MRAEVEFMVLPYDAQTDSLLHVLVRELSADRWTTFRGAIAFARQSGNYVDLLDAMQEFLNRGGRVELTFGADVFGRRGFGSEYEAVETLLTTFSRESEFQVYLYHEQGRTFHPKVYLLANESEDRALVIVGSSNWSHGGFVDNVEANVLVWLDLTEQDHRACYDRFAELFDRYWKESE